MAGSLVCWIGLLSSSRPKLSRIMSGWRSWSSPRRSGITSGRLFEAKALKDHAELLVLRGLVEKNRGSLEDQARLKAEIQVHLSHIEEMNSKIERLEKEAESHARELWEVRTEKAKQKRRIELLGERVAELEKEEQETKNLSIAKQSELRSLKSLLQITTIRAEKACKELEHESELVNQVQQASAQKSEEISKLKEKIIHLESIPKGVSKEDVKTHLIKITELTKTASETEEKLNHQLRQFENLKKEEKSHLNEIRYLSEKLKQAEEEEAQTKLEVNIKDEKIAALKKALDSANQRLEALTKENIHLEEENKREMKLLNDSMKESSIHLLQIGILAQLVKQLEEDQKGYLKDLDQEEISEYVRKVSELQMLLKRAENNLTKKNHSISNLVSKKDQMNNEIALLTKKLKEVQEEEGQIQEVSELKDEQVAMLKSSLALALSKLEKEHRKMLFEELEVDRIATESSYLKDECERRGETIQNLEKGVIMLEEVVDDDKVIENNLRKELKKTAEEVERMNKEESELKEHLQLLARKCQSLEGSAGSEKKFEQESELLGLEYKKMFEETAKKFQQLALNKALGEIPINEQDVQVEKNLMNYSSKISENLEKLGEFSYVVPLEQASLHFGELQAIRADLRAAEQRRLATEADLRRTLADETDAVKLVFLLSDKLATLEADSERVEDLEKKAHQQEILRFKAMLLAATERMRDLSMQNKELKDIQRQSESAIELSLSKANSLLTGLKELGEKLEASEASNQTAFSQIKQYQTTIDELRQQLSEGELIRSHREKELKDLEVQDKQHQELLADLHNKISERGVQKSMLELETSEKQIIERLTREIAELRAKLSQSIAGMNQQFSRTKSLQVKEEPISSKMLRLEEQNQTQMVRLSMQNKRIQNLISEQKKHDEGLYTMKVANLNEKIKVLETENAQLSLELDKLRNSLSSQPKQSAIISESKSDSNIQTKLTEMEAELSYLRSIPRGVPEDIVELVRIKNSELSAKIKTLEAELRERDMNVLYEESPVRKLTKQVEAIKDRIKELNSEREAAQGKPFDKESEYNNPKHALC
jgi:chromosome segregation ATPase